MLLINQRRPEEENPGKHMEAILLKIFSLLVEESNNLLWARHRTYKLMVTRSDKDGILVAIRVH